MWIQNKQVANQQKVFELATEMINRVTKFYEHYKKIGTCLGAAQKAFDEGQKKLEDKGMSIVKSAKDLAKLGANGGKDVLEGISFDDDSDIKQIAENQ